LTTIQLWVAMMPRQRTVRAEKIRTTASVWANAGGNSPTLDRSAFLQSTMRPREKYNAVDTSSGRINSPIIMKRRILIFHRTGHHAR
jgi:hypothetical protein